jgi:hypothetical protein
MKHWYETKLQLIEGNKIIKKNKQNMQSCNEFLIEYGRVL